jgi:hypothetical protein
MSEDKGKHNPEVDKKTAKGKGEGGFSPHPDGHANDDFQGEDLSKEQARQVTPAGKARSK